ncbi:PHB depolymerase family esterase [Kibdelosporangium aridum]|uniref:Esterase PHB depolymerase n=1 Tax=Kibdelosporangium aridum TaxID=2030 RepID=A0A1W2FBT5_KIBAR|nr:PHB depolymerase family esterase [Kibdelosporangium aridum]SMD19377.1 Esterase PHB depolymerase [Kibdelosporangium aridum]
MTSMLYTHGSTPLFASQVDQRLHYCLHVPRELPDLPAPLVVIQHGTGRTAQKYRTAMRDFAEEHKVVVLAPLFPAGLIDPDDVHNFKFIEYRGIRFDLMLLAIIDEVAARYPVAADRFYLHGFSGGGQFTHRFLFLHPQRLAAASIGAPGRITLLDDSLPWWLGTKGFQERFGRSIDLDAVRRVPVHMVVGSEDTDTFEINNPGESNWMNGCEKTGRTRVERLDTLRRNFESNGIKVIFDVVDGAGHSGSAVLPAVQRFFGSLIGR